MAMEKEGKFEVLNNAILLVLAMVVLFSFLVSAAPSFIAGNNGPYNATEDNSTLFTFNFTNITNTGGETVTYSIRNVSVVPTLNLGNDPSNYSWIAINTTTGIFSINATSNNQTGIFNITVEVVNSESAGQSDVFRFNVTAVNDAPTFVNLANLSFNISSLFNVTINTKDEESNTPFSFNVTFVSCSTAQWSSRGNTSCALFNISNSTQYNTNGTAINISFTPAKNDVGSYIINFSVTDSGTPNATYSRLTNYTVLNINSIPYFRYVCDNERNATEDNAFSCFINASDIDEINNLTFSSNESWFLTSNTSNVNITSSFNGSISLSFTANDSVVGNWTINVSVTDTLGAVNSTLINFSIANVNDSVFLDYLSNLSAYATSNYTLFVNASDNDLLIPDKRAYNESITFTSNVSWVNISPNQTISGTNISMARILVYPNSTFVGNNLVNITVRDANNFSIHSRILNITVLANNAPSWGALTQTNHSLQESTNFFLNLSLNVSDSQNDSLNFTFVNDTAFSSFSVNLTTGVINFTPIDADIGQHMVNITVSDNASASSVLSFNFTVSNINDVTYAVRPLNTTNATINHTNYFANITEGNYTTLRFYVEDDDFRIPSNQRGFYNESITVNLTLRGPNTKLFNFTLNSSYTDSSFPNRTEFYSIFTANSSDRGNYNVTINATDSSGSSSSFSFNLTITSINHLPSILGVSNITSSIFENITIDLNVTDMEDGSDSSASGNFTFTLTNLTSAGNFLTINRTNGIINFSLNRTYAGMWNYNVSVNDSKGVLNSSLFTLFVYDYPIILLPSLNSVFNFRENATFMLNISANHTVANNLTYTLFINGVQRNETSRLGNATPFLWNFTSNFTDETTCLGTINLTLNISNQKLSNVTSWNLTINHTDFPLVFSGNIGGTNRSINSSSLSTSVTLSDYYTDHDATDCNNQTILFSYSLIAGTASGSTITVAITDWINRSSPLIEFSSTGTGSANYSLTGSEYNISAVSQLIRTISANNFSVSLTTPSSSSSGGGSGGGGGGGGSSSKLTSLKLILPGPVSSGRRDKIIIPIEVVNEGVEPISNIVLRGTISKDGILRRDLIASFDNSVIDSLQVGERRNVTFIVDVNTEEDGLYEITINATAESPPIKDYGKIFLTIDEGKKTRDRIIFTNQFLIDNSECLEIREILKEAEKAYKEGDFALANRKLDQVIDGCKKIISQSGRFVKRPPSIDLPIFSSVIVASLVAFIFGFTYYYYHRIKLRKVVKLKNAD